MGTRRRNNTRLAVRVTTDDWAVWYACSIYLEKPLSAIIRDAIEEYIADPPMYVDLREFPFGAVAGMADRFGLRSALRESTRLNKVIVLRLSTEDLRQWKLLAHAYKSTVSVIIRRAVRHHLRHYEPIIRSIASEGKE